MEEPKLAQNPPQNLTPQAPQTTKKRPLENNANIQDSKYFKMCAVLKDLRPHFIEVHYKHFSRIVNGNS